VELRISSLPNLIITITKLNNRILCVRGGYEYVILDGSDCGMNLFYVIESGGKNDHPPSDGGNGPPPPPAAMAGVGKARATGTVTAGDAFVYSGALVVSSNSKLVVSTLFPLMADWASLLTWDSSSSIDVPVMTGTTFYIMLTF
jgi:hypothetical protein